MKVFFSLILVLVSLKAGASEPQLSEFNVARVVTKTIKNGIQLQCKITDTSGIYDTLKKYDGLKHEPTDKSVYIKWDIDGEIEKNARYTSMSLDKKIGEDIYITDYFLNISEDRKEISLVYQVCAYNNQDTQGKSNLFSLIKIISTGEVNDNQKNIELIVVMKEVIKKYKEKEIKFFNFDQSVSYREF